MPIIFKRSEAKKQPAFDTVKSLFAGAANPLRRLNHPVQPVDIDPQKVVLIPVIVLAIVDLSRSKAGLIEKAHEKQKDIYPIPPNIFLKTIKTATVTGSNQEEGTTWHKKKEQNQ
jgi:hypothetical protein